MSCFKKTVALIPLRGGSKSIPKKNIRLLSEIPLCIWVLKSALLAKYISDVYVSTDSEEIADIVLNHCPDVKIVDRPSQYATDTASTEDVMSHFLSVIETDILVTMQATSPLTEPYHIDEALFKFHDEKLDSLFTAIRLKRFLWSDQIKPINYVPKNRPRRQDFHGTLMENGAFYITDALNFQKNRTRLFGEIGVYEMTEEHGLELDEEEDWLKLEAYISQKRSG